MGLLLGSYLLFLPLTIMVLLVFAAGALSRCEKKRVLSGKQGLVLYVCALLGIAYWLLGARTDQGVALPFQTGRQEVMLSGVVTAPVEHGPGRVTMIVPVESVQQDTASRDVRGNLRLTWRPCKSGNECEPDTEIRPSFGTRNPGGFDYGAYLRARGIHAVAPSGGLIEYGFNLLASSTSMNGYGRRLIVGGIRYAKLPFQRSNSRLAVCFWI